MSNPNLLKIKKWGDKMYIQATIQCECGCISRYEIQSPRKSYVCPKCRKSIEKKSFSKLWDIMGELSDWNEESAKDASGYGHPLMRVISLTTADLIDQTSPYGASQE